MFYTCKEEVTCLLAEEWTEPGQARMESHKTLLGEGFFLQNLYREFSQSTRQEQDGALTSHSLGSSPANYPKGIRGKVGGNT